MEMHTVIISLLYHYSVDKCTGIFYMYNIDIFSEDEKIIPSMFRVCAFLVSLPGESILFSHSRFSVYLIVPYFTTSMKN